MNAVDLGVNLFVTLFALLDPIGNLPIFAAATAGATLRQRISVSALIRLFAMLFLSFFLFIVNHQRQCLFVHSCLEVEQLINFVVHLFSQTSQWDINRASALTLTTIGAPPSDMNISGYLEEEIILPPRCW